MTPPVVVFNVPPTVSIPVVAVLLTVKAVGSLLLFSTLTSPLDVSPLLAASVPVTSSVPAVVVLFTVTDSLASTPFSAVNVCPFGTERLPTAAVSFTIVFPATSTSSLEVRPF